MRLRGQSSQGSCLVGSRFCSSTVGRLSWSVSQPHSPAPNSGQAVSAMGHVVADTSVSG